MGLAGLALIPKYASRFPLVHGEELKSVAVPLSGPLISILPVSGPPPLLGSSTSTKKSPEKELPPGSLEKKPKSNGGLLVVGECSAEIWHCRYPPQKPHSAG